MNPILKIQKFKYIYLYLQRDFNFYFLNKCLLYGLISIVNFGN
jgi:hypothetical protein